MKKFTLLLSVMLLTGLQAVLGQDIRITGTVTSDTGEPLVGVAVVVDGTQRGVVTNGAGEYSISAPSNATLQFLMVGMKLRQVAVEGRSRIDVVLEADAQTIDNVIVTAFGTSTKEAFTGSAGVISADQLAQTQSSNVSKALAGAVAGLQITSNSGQPGSKASIRIRGLGSFSASSEPLIVVDGIPYDGGLENINPMDIESLTVLKDAASNALYGARGANGVIMITTKKGKNAEAVITVDAKWGVNSRALQSYDMIDDPAQYYETHYASLYNYIQSKNPDAAESALAGWANTNLIDSRTYGLGYNVYTVPEGEAMIVNGKLNPNAKLGRVVGDYKLLPDNWTDEAFVKTLRQEYNVSVSGGTERSSNYLSVGYLNDKGIVRNSDFSRITARLKSDYQAKKWLKVGGNVGYANFDGNRVNEDESSSGNIFLYTNTIAPIYPVYIRDAQGNVIRDENGIIRYDYGDGKNAGLSRPILNADNPISSNYLDKNNYNGNAFNTNGFAEVKFLKDFKFTFNAGFDLDETRTSQFTNPFYGQHVSKNGVIYKYHTRTTGLNLQQLLTWTRSFGNHNVDVLVGHENYKYKYTYLYGSKENMLSPSVQEIAGAIKNPKTNSYVKDYNTEGYFGRAQYNYDGKYFLSASYRRDASSRFHPDHRWGNFWSVGGAWLMNREEFLAGAAWIDLLKVKASYGVQGNDGIGDYRYVDNYDVVNAAGNVSAVFYTKGNPNITWESNYNLNVGVEFGFFGNRLSGSIEYFSRKTEDLLFSRPTPTSIGYYSYYDNIGDMRNRGVEIDLTGVLLNRENVRWTLSLNATHYKNKVLKLPPEKKDGFETGTYFVSEGGSRYDWYMPRYAGVSEEGLSMWYQDVKDAQGNVTETVTTTDYSSATYYNLGSVLPDLYGGISTSVSAYGFDLGVTLAYQIGGKVYDDGYAGLMHSVASGSRGIAWHKDILNAWTPKNTETNVPRLQFNDENINARSDRFLMDASYLSLQNISFGYTFPEKWTSKLGIQSLRIYLAADNVAFVSKRKGFDPRQNWDGSTLSETYSPIRTVSGGVSFRF